MSEYLNNLLTILEIEKNNKLDIIKGYNEFLNKNKEEEIFSSSYIIDDLILRGETQSKEHFNNLMKKIVVNHHIITVIINKIIKTLSNNLDNFPYSVKCILKMIDVLLNKKNNNNNISHLKNYLFKLNFLIGNLIMPILKNPNYNGIISNIISDITKKNLQIIYDIFEKMLEGSLFKRNEDDSMVLYNKFIIESLPKLFEIIDNLGKNFELPDYVNRLINSFDNKERNINYNYFKEKKNENIQFQCVCFSLLNIFIFYGIIGINEKSLIEDNKNLEQKKILNEFIKSLKKVNFIEKYMVEKEEGKNKYYYFTRILYNYNIEKILENISIKTLNKNKEDIIPTYKKCLEEVLSYENYYYLTEFKKINENKIENNVKKNNIKIKRKNALRSSLINALESINEEDADFRKIIFPKIENNLIYELNSEQDNKLIIFCINYLKLNIENLLNKYKKNNYSLLFNEIIIEIKNKIDILNSNIIFEHYKKINEAEKINILSSYYNSQIKNLEKLEYIKYLYQKLLLPCDFIVEKGINDVIIKMKYCSENEMNNIENMINNFPDFRSYEKEYDNILDIEEKAEVPKAIKDYFSAMKILIKDDYLFDKLEEKEKREISYDLENYILNKLHDKIFPSQFSEEDLFIYQKCEKLYNMKPEQIIDNKKIINQNLLKEASKYFQKISIGITPKEKLDYMLKGLKIIQNLITLVTGKELMGSDDIYESFFYSMCIAKIKNLSSNVQYINMYLNRNLGEGVYNRISTDLEGALLFIVDLEIKN